MHATPAVGCPYEGPLSAPDLEGLCERWVGIFLVRHCELLVWKGGLEAVDCSELGIITGYSRAIVVLVVIVDVMVEVLED